MSERPVEHWCAVHGARLVMALGCARAKKVRGTASSIGRRTLIVLALNPAVNQDNIHETI